MECHPLASAVASNSPVNVRIGKHIRKGKMLILLVDNGHSQDASYRNATLRELGQPTVIHRYCSNRELNVYNLLNFISCNSFSLHEIDKLPAMARALPFGLPNFGNTSFCNATLQALRYTPILYQILASNGDGNTCREGKVSVSCMHDTKYSAAVSVRCYSYCATA